MSIAITEDHRALAETASSSGTACRRRARADPLGDRALERLD